MPGLPGLNLEKNAECGVEIENAEKAWTECGESVERAWKKRGKSVERA